MASVQCYKPAEQQPCQQQQQHQSFGQKVTHVVTSVFKKDQAHQAHQAHHQAHATNQCNTTTNNGHFPMGTTNGTHTHETQCHGNGKTRRTQKKRGLIEKMKDSLSGHSSDSSSSSESDSDDDTKCARNKN